MDLNQTDVMLAILGLLLMVVGYIGAFVYYIITLIENFKESVGWGIASLLLGIPWLVFVIMRFGQVKKPFLRMLGCFALSILGLIVAALGADPSAVPAQTTVD